MKIAKFVLSLTFIALMFPLAALAQEEEGNKRHPTYTLMGRDAPAADSPLNPNFVVAEESRLSEGGFWRSPYINESLVGLVVADIDGDGQNEVIYASTKTVTVTRFGGGKLGQLAKFTVMTTEVIASVDALDLTGDGRMEIICSVQNETFNPASKIFSFTGDDLVVMADKIPWYLRVVGGPGGQFLAGQRASTDRKAVYAGKVMRMGFDGSQITSQGSVGLPSNINLFNFSLGRLGRSGIQMVAAIKFPTEHIFLFENGTERAWESKEEYGGTMTHLLPANASVESNRFREFLPSRLLITDIDGDGQNELIVAKNDRGGVPFMSGQRAFTSGVIQAFKYTNMSLTPFFRTRTLPGPAVDYALADFKNNGNIELVVAVVTEQKSGALKEGRSVIVSYEIRGPQ
ncbi:FG-GAP-like repeat-containing protein [Deltaproteobacteria bacterium OttesenSCG-928-M10]|nr:FG-GAP-like repeat-containing protein [Deltaproteobacteria bacterium OttesenSCG-928-M10]